MRHDGTRTKPVHRRDAIAAAWAVRLRIRVSWQHVLQRKHSTRRSQQHSSRGIWRRCVSISKSWRRIPWVHTRTYLLTRRLLLPLLCIDPGYITSEGLAAIIIQQILPLSAKLQQDAHHRRVRVSRRQRPSALHGGASASARHPRARTHTRSRQDRLRPHAATGSLTASPNATAGRGRHSTGTFPAARQTVRTCGRRGSPDFRCDLPPVRRRL